VSLFDYRETKTVKGIAGDKGTNRTIRFNMDLRIEKNNMALILYFGVVTKFAVRALGGNRGKDNLPVVGGTKKKASMTQLVSTRRPWGARTRSEARGHPQTGTGQTG